MPRRLGQHFLKNQSILERIAGAVCPDLEPTVIEIGPGRGALTGHLLPRAGRVVAVEVDRALADVLRARFGGDSSLEIVIANVLETDLAQWGPAVVAGNLPYYITSPIVEKVLSLGPSLRRAVFLVQHEVAERLAAGPGSRDYGLLSVRTQLLARVEILFAVPSAAFQPAPKVDSAVVRLTPQDRTGELGLDDAERFLAFAGLCFTQKRKTLRNNLAGTYGREALDALPEAGLRAEQLSVERLAALYRVLTPAAPPAR
ncbi:MAG: 16S rRNA (adenine(1518)-N(6)/adenine(1519)-N(6))-dimethyltransferase RsmA [Bryobacterales bacterium]|nr:16S rRNA (adenine(1518)-N(6)/adenine(1519)-N(6))-dimethyltransferase RsmA [Bryobacterales bacterium]